ncbi:DUF4179 domain-containing protein [Bacillaceae bacterium CLA-AA-H227]|uniref:DUF4179 domain-containing protein n=1 Tax=Robertmurraya yapensis (ex Hitch et al 2024) TaxID=3133160 RepID=A0ACC6SFX6_9BACI
MKDKYLQEIFEQIEVPIEDVRQSIRIGIQKAELQAKKKNPLFRNLSVAAILFITTVFTLSFSFPAFAQKIPIIGNIFELFEENENEYIFEDYNRYATELGITKESNGVSMTFTEAVYDGENITVAFTINSEHDLGEKPFIEWEIADTDSSLIVGGRQITRRMGKNEYAGLLIFDLQRGTHSDTIQLKWEANRIGYFDVEKDPLNMLNPIVGSWSFNLTLDNIGSQKQEFMGLVSKGEGMETSLKEITTTPISTSLYFTEMVDDKYKEENWETVLMDYEVSDNLGNKYTVVSNGAWGNNGYVMHSRITTTKIDKEASYISITPIVSILKEKDEQNHDSSGIELELLKDPFKLEPIEVPLKQNAN